jgi:hypothetical protein
LIGLVARQFGLGDTPRAGDDGIAGMATSSPGMRSAVTD